jgi:hypothetical protein
MAIGLDDFIAKWTAGDGGAERANYSLFLTELCAVLDLPAPQPAAAATLSAYQFEGPVRSLGGDVAPKRIDLYKRGCFILEAKQSVARAREAAPQTPSLFGEAPVLGKRGTGAKWDEQMRAAFRQAMGYFTRLPAEHPSPPFVIICDVGHCFELWADFTGTGRGFRQFPDRNRYRVYLEDLRKPDVRALFAAIWTDPHSLDPTRNAARVTRAIADRLAGVSRALERDHAPEEVALFLMRCVFTMFAEDVELLPKDSFKTLLAECLDAPDQFAPLMHDLWRHMDEGTYFSAFKARLPKFNGELFADARAYPLGREEIGELLAAARADWREVEPAIFGTLLEQALDPAERASLGAHYTPRAYVERLVEATVMEPLRGDWRDAQIRIEALEQDGDRAGAVKAAQAFHADLCKVRVLDPACGTGNFLYVALELMKRLEGEVIETLVQLGETQGALGYREQTVDPHQFLGLEKNPRAAAIAELVLWIGYLQQHYRQATGHPGEPILKRFHNITQMDAVLTWKGYPVPQVKDGREVLPEPRVPPWPTADFIIGNPPFIGGKDLRARLGDAYAEGLWAAHKAMNDSADFVMYWWNRAAELLTAKGTALRRFGFVTTNSITQVFQRRTIERWRAAKRPLSLVFAIGDHPWTRATKDAAAVRIAMTAAQAGSAEGRVLTVTTEADLDTDAPRLTFAEVVGAVNPDLTVGVDVTRAQALLANEGLCSPGVKLHGAGFIVTPEQAAHLGLGRRPGLEAHIRPYRNGRDLTARSRDVMVIDFWGLDEAQVRQRFPEAYQHLMTTVLPSRRDVYEKSRTKDALAYAEAWWLFGKPRSELRPALEGLPRYIATVETAKHRVFQFLDATILPDNKLLAIGSGEASHLGVLSSTIHFHWYQANAGMLGVYDRDAVYVKTACFDPFPFPDASPDQQAAIAAPAEELDALRKRVLAEHPHLTLTGLYNVVERLRAGATRADLDPAEQRTFDDGLCAIIKELHDRIDVAVADAYGWPANLNDQDILARLVALNAERRAEEAAGQIRWLRPDYQAVRFGPKITRKADDLGLTGEAEAAAASLPAFPSAREEQAVALMAMLAAADAPQTPAELAARFRPGARKLDARIRDALAILVRYGWAVEGGDGRFVAQVRTAA